ncbi:hypothetical protein TGDOM2_397730, partial [Toxoplasma gondii GAB2-2007-GAL-DOM2]
RLEDRAFNSAGKQHLRETKQSETGEATKRSYERNKNISDVTTQHQQKCAQTQIRTCIYMYIYTYVHTRTHRCVHPYEYRFRNVQKRRE